ncbi:TonB-dependent siderophore receptor [Pseudomonas aeruginosa]|uniref:TonB-dependent siderophore receptor n=1 Tax=Pseudomonas aeruginosa TaxID=287 RepID=UPI00104B8DD1|nr:TonB-dependent siderophore receptor [Pseudomonas aeruginosa]
MKHVVSSALLLGLSSLSLAAQAAPIALDLPAQPLAASLEQLQGASGLRIRFDRAAVADRRAPALRGTLEPSEALQRLLAGSGLSGEVRGGDAWVEAAATGAGIAPGDSVDLGALSVVATQDPATAAITEDSGSYTTRAMRTSTKLAMSIRERLMQGAGNPAAAINMVRKRPTQDFRASLQGSVGTWDRYRSEADVSGPLNSEGTLRGRAVVAYQKGNSFQDHVSSERGVFYGIAEADLSPDTTFAIGASNQNDNRNDNWVGLPSPLGGRHLDLKRSSYYGADWSYWDTDTTHLFSDLTHRFANGWQMKLAADKLWARINMLGLYNDCYYSTTGCASMTQNPGDYSYTDDHDSYDAYANGPFQLLGREHELVVGASYRQERFDGHGGWGSLFNKDGTLTGPMDPTQWDPSSTLKPRLNTSLWGMKLDQEQKGAYLTTRLNLADPLKVILGGRLDWYKADADTDSYKVTRNVTRYAGVIYDLNQTYSVYASYTDIFKPQSNFDAGGGLLDPITGKNYEIGLKGEHFGGALNSQIALFQIDQENRATEDVGGPSPCPFSPTSRYCSRASGKVRSQGVDLELSGALSDDWQMMAGYTYVDAKYKHDSNKANEGKPFDAAKPRHLFKLATSYTLPGELHKWRVGGDLATQSKTEDSSTGFQQGGYTVVNAMLGYKVNERIDTRLNFNNLFDKYYYSGIDFGNLNYGEPRNLMFTVKYSL